MKSLFVEYKPFLVFLAKFLLFYIFFTFLYQMYLSGFDTAQNEIDEISVSVANQTKAFLTFFGQEATILKNPNDPSLKILYKGKYVSRMIEGCNAISVIILFAAFVFAFSVKFKRTFLYILLGGLVIHILNVVRIALLTYALYYYPAYEALLHGTVFPLFIYGVVFLLWVLWVMKFSGYDKRTS
ncbi:exosortase family protein XrtF [Flavobacterium sp. TP390]|uniref:Exosortase family protein XrtF n=1 Tax=Flavobacterium profundi TaxID=1774945 RepID=A0A6I4IG20_9FLAO|nr:exosortase family protein XrtF [Flavobacterium profundi]MVO08615.1 exosortase family protein XrtF [Flavobacterium profundi]